MSKPVTNIVQIRDQQALTTSLIVAEHCELAHKQVIALVRKYQSDFEELGPLAFETRKGEALPQGGFAKATEYALLNEDQATYLITLFRNTTIVRRFKLALVKAFRKAINALNSPARAGVIRAKRDANRLLTDALVEAREEAGKAIKPYHFSNEALLCNEIVTGQRGKLDESTLSLEDADLLRRVRERDAALVTAGITYPERKARLTAFAIRQRTQRISSPATN